MAGLPSRTPAVIDPPVAERSRDHVSSPALEFAVESAAGVKIALAVGADRVELCADLAATGGVTPTLAAVDAACAVGLPVHVLVRPRPGGFTYTDDELEAIERDCLLAVRAGAAGVVVGMLALDGGPHTEVLRRVAGVVRSEEPTAQVTFHREFDAALASGVDPAAVLETLSGAGTDRVLTSGGASDCMRGLEGLRRLVELGREATPGLEIMAGGGVTAALVPPLVGAGVHAVHASARGRRGTIDEAVASAIACRHRDAVAQLNIPAG
ncbi:copper homeostasis protein CutC [Sinomonas sp. P10A9]|uniref:PF03932 family protein CutC n=1 Tax=Sinomonas puerhi TaxID=3238584 RepID=A0AB39L661_9MICC